MAQPHKGDRHASTLRLPVPIVERIKSLNVPDRNGWIVDAIERKLMQEETDGLH
jgi:hypothetical protein